MTFHEYALSDPSHRSGLAANPIASLQGKFLLEYILLYLVFKFHAGINTGLGGQSNVIRIV